MMHRNYAHAYITTIYETFTQLNANLSVLNTDLYTYATNNMQHTCVNSLQENTTDAAWHGSFLPTAQGQ
jgi:hypothetical protein